MGCEGFDERSTAVELFFSTLASLLSFFGGLSLLRSILQKKGGQKEYPARVQSSNYIRISSIVSWVAITDMLWGLCYTTMFAWLFFERPPNRCDYATYTNGQYLLLASGSSFVGASCGYTLMVGYQLLKILRNSERNLQYDDNPNPTITLTSNPLPRALTLILILTLNLTLTLTLTLYPATTHLNPNPNSNPNRNPNSNP
jgi:hypothetical protein